MSVTSLENDRREADCIYPAAELLNEYFIKIFERSQGQSSFEHFCKGLLEALIGKESYSKIPSLDNLRRLKSVDNNGNCSPTRYRFTSKLCRSFKLRTEDETDADLVKIINSIPKSKWLPLTRELLLIVEKMKNNGIALADSSVYNNPSYDARFFKTLFWDIVVAIKENDDRMIDFSAASAEPVITNDNKALEQVVDKNVSLGAALDKGFFNAVLDFRKPFGEERLIDEFIDCLNQKEIKSKFMYHGKEAARKYLNLTQSVEYRVSHDTLDLLHQNIDSIINEVTKSNKPVRLISLGPGDGSKETFILKKLLQSTDGIVEYFVFDISEEIMYESVKLVQSTLSMFGHRLFVKVFPLDFMDIDAVLGDTISDKQNLFLLLGGTVVNFEEQTLLSKIKSVMQVGDFFLIDGHLKKDGKLSKEDEDKLLSIYQSEAIDEHVYAIFKRAKLYPQDGVIIRRLSYEYKNSGELLENYNCVVLIRAFRIKKTKLVEICGRPVKYFEGSEIVVCYSKKYTKTALINLLRRFFDVKTENIYYLGNDYSLMLCRKTNV